MRTKYTPGPWYFETDGDVIPACHRDRYVVPHVDINKPNSGGRICTMHLLDSDSQTELDANARLIAAAPELLESLEDLEIILSGKPYNRTEQVLLQQARAVIKKATGAA